MADGTSKSPKKSAGKFGLTPLADVPFPPAEINDRVRYIRSLEAGGIEPPKGWKKRKLHWRFNPKNLTLYTAKSDYEIDLEEIKNSASMLDWIFQIEGKTWGTDEVIAELLLFFSELFNPQGKLCSFGREQGPINPKKVISENMRGWQ